MPNLRIVLVDVECDTPAMAASILQLALNGEAPVGDTPAPSTVPIVQQHPLVGQEPEPEPERANAAQRPARKPAAPARPAAPVADSGYVSIKTQVLELLKKGKPLSSLEVAHALKLEPAQVYSPLSVLKTAGEIESFLDEERDVSRRWRVR